MKKQLLKLITIFTVIITMTSCSYNSMVEKDESISGQWAQVETQYQRRSDLIPNLVSIVKGYASHEKEVLQGVVEARAKATSMNIDASNLTPETMQQFQAAQGELSSALSRLLVTVEAYPDLKANQNFLELQSQLEGTENRIAVERKRFNELVKEYNAFIRKFPKNITASIFGFEKREYFEIEEGSEKAPKIEF